MIYRFFISAALFLFGLISSSYAHAFTSDVTADPKADLLITGFYLDNKDKAFDIQLVEQFVLSYNAEHSVCFKKQLENKSPEPFLQCDSSEVYKPNSYAQLLQFKDAYVLSFTPSLAEEGMDSTIVDGTARAVNYLFRLGQYKSIYKFEGSVMSFADPSLLLNIDGTESCMGSVPSGKITVLDVVSQQFQPFLLNNRGENFESRFEPLDDLKLQGRAGYLYIDSSLPLSQSFHNRPGCEIGVPAQILTTKYLIDCRSNSTACRVRKLKTKSHYGCSPVGACD